MVKEWPSVDQNILIQVTMLSGYYKLDKTKLEIDYWS